MKTFSISNFVKPNDDACASGQAPSHSRTFDRFGESSYEADSHSPAPDREHDCGALFERAVRGDSDAATQLYSRCVPPLRAWLTLRLPFHMAEEIAHDALVEAFRKNGQFNPGTRFEAWLKTIAWNGALNRLRTSSRRAARELAYVEHERVAAVADANPSPALEVVTSCVEALPLAQRELLRLHYHERQTSRQIASAQGRSRSAVAVNLHRICKGLRHDVKLALRGAVGMALVAFCAAMALPSAQASIAYGSINNFDTVNDTGHECHGFEIELEDCHSTDITYTYNYNHYGVPQITEDNSVAGHPKCLIRWASKKNADGSWAAYTAIPAGPIAPTNGHMFTNPAVNFGGEHFGVGYRVQPTAVHYFWLIDNGAGGLIHGGAVQVSTPSFTYFPPVAGGNPAPAQVQAAIAPPPPPAPEPKEFGKAVWVKEIRTTTHNNEEVKLRDLVSDDPEDPNDKNWRNGEPDEIEIEWQILQKDYNKADGGANNELLAAAEDLPGGDEVVTRRYEFYKYTGPLDNETGEAMADAVAADDLHGVGSKIINGVNVDLSTLEVVGAFTGSQMAAVDVDAPVGLIDHVGEARINAPFAPRAVVVEGALPFTCVQDGALPAGMTFDEVTGVLAGTPTASGEFAFKVTASDGVNADVSKNYTLIVAAAGEALPPVSLLDTTAAPVDTGTTTGDGSYAVGESATVTATAVPGFSFLNWTDNGAIVSTNASYTLTMDVNHSLVANFVAQTSYTITTGAVPAAGGTTNGDGSFASGTNATVTAVANAGYTFANWTLDGTVVSSVSSYTLVVAANQLLIANFIPAVGVNRTIATSSNPVAGGSTSGGGTYADGTSVTVVAVPNANYIFKRWQEAGAAVSSNASYTFTATADRVLEAKFAAIYPVTTSSSPALGGTTSVTGSFEDGDNVTVLATPNAGFTFVNWTLDGTMVSASASYSFTANPARHLVANFSGPPGTYTINASAMPVVGGTTSGGGTIAAGGSVTLIATANAGYDFIHWTTTGGVEVSASPSYTFTPTESGDYVAHFVPSSVGIPFDFDTAIPVPALDQPLPIDQTSLGLTATFSSPVIDAFRVRTEAASGQTLAKFSGNYLECSIDAATLTIQLAQPATGVSMDFATVEALNVPLPSDLQITAIDHSSGVPVAVGTAIAHGVVAAGDSLPVGTISLNTAGSSFDEITVQLPALPDGAQRFLIDNLVVSSTTSTGGTMLLANPNWNITLTDFGYSDFLLDNTPGFEGREYLSGEWGSAIGYQRNGHTEGPTWLEPNFLFPDWKTNSNFQTVSGIHVVGSNADGLPIAESVIANSDLQITLRFEMVDTVVGTPMGVQAASAAGGGASINSNRYVLNQTFVVKNISGTTLSNVQLFQLLHGFISQRGQHDNRSYGGQLSQYHFDTTMSGIDASAAGGQSSTVGLEDLIGFHSKVAPSGFEVGHYGIEGNGIDDHALGKPSDGVHLSIEDNWQRAPYDSRLGRDLFAPVDRWLAGAQRWELGTLIPGQSVSFDILLSLLTGTKVTVDVGGGGSTGGGSCNGGSSHVGGVDFEFEDIDEEGTFFGEFSEADDDELLAREGYGEFLLPTFGAPNAHVHQLWELEYSGAYTGNIHLTFAYNPALLPAGYDENQLAIYHFRNGVWEKLNGQVDTQNHLIRVVTSSLSPFALGINDVVVEPLVEVSAGSPGSIRVTWPASFTDWILQESPDMSAGSWVNSAHPVTVIDGVKQGLVPITGGGARFFRLIKP